MALLGVVGSFGCFGCLGVLGVWVFWVFGPFWSFSYSYYYCFELLGVRPTSSRLGLYNIILTKRDGGPQTPTNPSELRRSLCVVPGPTPQTGRHDKVKAGQELIENVKLFLSDPAGPALFLGQAEAAALVSISPTRTPITFANKESSHP